MYLVVSLLVLRAGCGICLYQFLIIDYPFTSDTGRSMRQIVGYECLGQDMEFDCVGS